MTEYSRKKLNGNIGYTTIIDPKFKTQKVHICFLTELNQNTVSENALAIGIIGSSNSKYKNISEITAKLNSLYGANINISVSKWGNIQRLSVEVSNICSKYALEGENISNDVAAILIDCILSPNICVNPDTGKTEFAAEPFDFRKKDLIDTIEAEINNKRGYAVMQANKSIFKDECCAISSYGTKETARNATPSSAYAAYKNLLSNAQIEIYFVGAEKNEEIEKMISDAFAGVNRSSDMVSFYSPSPIKNQVCRTEEKLDVNQCKMVMAFKCTSTDHRAIKLMNTIFGATPISKLFVNVREKQSLCYYCASRYNRFKNTIIVDCGIEEKNIEKTENEILNQLNEIKNGNITEDEIKNSVLSIKNSLKGIGDTTTSYIEWYFSCFAVNEVNEPDNEADEIAAISRERIIEAARSFELDTVYVMRGEANGN